MKAQLDIHRLASGVLEICLSSSLDSSWGFGSGLGGSCGSLFSLGVGLGVVVLLARRVDGDLDSDFAALDLLAVHLGAGLLLQVLGSQSNEAEATALAGLVAGLELLDHKAGNGTESDLGGRGFVVLEDFQKLWVELAMSKPDWSRHNYLVLLQVIRQVSNHDLSL